MVNYFLFFVQSLYLKFFTVLLYQLVATRDGMRAANRYILPVPKEALPKIDRTTSPAHIGELKNAVDFVVDEGTPVLASAEGVVMYVSDGSYTGGPSIEYWHASNFIVIQHDRGEYTRYDHLAYKSARVIPGQHVKRSEEHTSELQSRENLVCRLL